MPLKNKSVNIVLDGATLIHVNDYEKVLKEYIRISRNFVILHSLTLYDGDKNLLLSKYAYGQKVLENIFSVSFLNKFVESNGLKILAKFTGENYNLNDLIGISTTSETWVLGER
jgi:ubiquinone/menaquinone biosynthesis C-methylase UbiE